MRTYPGLLLLAAVIAGILCAELFQPAITTLIVISLIASVVGLVPFIWLRWRLAAVGFALTLGSLAALHYAHVVYQLPPSHFSHIADPRQYLQIFGEVADWPEIKPDRTEFIVELDSLGGNVAQRASGRILLRISDTTTALQRGDRVEFFGRIYPVEQRAARSQFDYNRYLNLKGIFGAVYLDGVLDVRVNRRAQLGFFSLIDRLRSEVRDVLHANLSPSCAALASGFLIGETRDIPVEVYQRFRDSGTLHLMAVSGSNVALVLVFFYLLLTPFALSRGKRAAILLGVMVVFTALSYGEPSVVRASVMASLVILAGLLQRRFDLNNIIAFAMLMILMVDPPELFDVGFQLSFVTAWGLIFVVPKVTDIFRPFHNRWWFRWIAFPLVVSFVAQVCSAPFIACYFGRIPLISLAANLVIVPLASIVLIGTLVMLFAHLILPVAGLLVGRVLDIVLEFLLGAVNLFGSSTLPSLEVNLRLDPVWWGVIMGSGLMFIAVAALALRSKSARRILVALLLVAANGGLVAAVVNATEQTVPRVYVTTVPGGVAVLNRPSDGEADLIITGLSEKQYPLDERILIPWLKSHGLDSLRYCVLMAGEYHALDDFVRLASQTGVRRVYVSSSIEGRFRQVWKEMAQGDESFDKVRFFGGDSVYQEYGYSLTRDAVVINYPNGELWISQEIEEVGRREKLNPGRPMVAIVGKAWRAEPSEWIAIHESGLNQVICPRVIQRVVQNETDPHASVAQDIPEYIHQLSRAGGIEIRLTVPLEIRPR